ncbi:P-loop containing nucleoside triphosphate hydrolase protein [Amanita muscaria]
METVLYSALLRLLRDFERIGHLNIKDGRIGGSGHRSISGGEKLRVSMACELVTSPSILFLDEPTSGLDAFNVFNVIESWVSLARNYNRTVIFTIHQPRSNIDALFDQLVVLAMGKLASGEFFPASFPNVKDTSKQFVLQGSTSPIT